MVKLKSSYAKLARAGINILNAFYHDQNSNTPEFLGVVFEYSWHDPEMRDKLHWSKAFARIWDDQSITNELLQIVEEARQELEHGE